MINCVLITWLTQNTITTSGSDGNTCLQPKKISKTKLNLRNGSFDLRLSLKSNWKASKTNKKKSCMGVSVAKPAPICCRPSWRTLLLPLIFCFPKDLAGMVCECVTTAKICEKRDFRKEIQFSREERPHPPPFSRDPKFCEQAPTKINFASFGTPWGTGLFGNLFKACELAVGIGWRTAPVLVEFVCWCCCSKGAHSFAADLCMLKIRRILATRPEVPAQRHTWAGPVLRTLRIERLELSDPNCGGPLGRTSRLKTLAYAVKIERNFVKLAEIVKHNLKINEESGK